jgi:hypothetical protein
MLRCRGGIAHVSVDAGRCFRGAIFTAEAEFRFCCDQSASESTLGDGAQDVVTFTSIPDCIHRRYLHEG